MNLVDPSEQIAQPQTPQATTGRPLSVDLITKEAKMLEGYPTSLRCSPLTVRHVKSLVYTTAEQNYYALLQEVMGQCVDFDLNRLAATDFDKLILFLRVNSCGKLINYQITCPECGTTTSASVDLTQLVINNLPEGFEEDKKLSNGLSLILPRLKTRIEFDDLSDLTELDTYAMFIQEGDSLQEKIRLLDEMSPKDLGEIEEFIESISDYGVKNAFKFTCLNPTGNTLEDGNPELCRRSDTLSVPFRGEFFLSPERTEPDPESVRPFEVVPLSTVPLGADELQ